MSTSNLMTYLLQSPVYLLGFFAILGFGWSAGRFKENVWHIVSCAMARLMSGGAFGVIDGGNSYDDYHSQRWRTILGRLSARDWYRIGSESARVVGDESGACPSPQGMSVGELY